jgi:CDP-diacylglycerol--serine O-phosphatidyltransferase
MSQQTPPPAEPTEANLERKGLKKGLYLIPSAFTTLNIGLGFYAIMSSLRAFQLLSDNRQAVLAADIFDNTAKAIGLAVICDALDGRLARMTKTTTEIGVQLDSIADIVTFGVAPAVMVYAWGYGSALAETHQLHKAGLLVSFVYLMCGGFRLARFNVQATRPRVLAEGTAKLDKKSFVGLPIPAAAGVIASIIHFAPAPLITYQASSMLYFSSVMMALVACLSILMVSTLRYTSFKSVSTERNSSRFSLIAIALLGMAVWLYSRQALLFLALCYAFHGIFFRVLSLFRSNPVGSK